MSPSRVRHEIAYALDSDVRNIGGRGAPFGGGRGGRGGPRGGGRGGARGGGKPGQKGGAKVIVVGSSLPRFPYAYGAEKNKKKRPSG